MNIDFKFELGQRVKWEKDYPLVTAPETGIIEEQIRTWFGDCYLVRKKGGITARKDESALTAIEGK